MDLLYEAHTVLPGSLRLSVSSGVQPHELFLPLLGAAGERRGWQSAASVTGHWHISVQVGLRCIELEGSKKIKNK